MWRRKRRADVSKSGSGPYELLEIPTEKEEQTWGKERKGGLKKSRKGIYR